MVRPTAPLVNAGLGLGGAARAAWTGPPAARKIKHPMARKHSKSHRPKVGGAGAGAATQRDGGHGPAEPVTGSFWQRNRREVTFLVLFVLLLGGSFTLISVNWVNDHVIEPFTAGIARVSGAALNLCGQHVAMRGTVIQGQRFAVNIRNGCNGVEAMLIFLSAVLAFPAPWRWRLGGLVLGSIAIQLINLVRVVSLYLTGVYFPRIFDASHTVIWQSVVILFGVLLWVLWANRLPAAHDEAAT
jgi:exosortase H (IPTLxxWG-CTERM-specific)